MPSASALILVAALLASAGAVGADARWLVAMGAFIVETGSIPERIPYAIAPSDGWNNVPVLSELVFYALHTAGGDTALLWAHITAACAGLGLVAATALRAGAAPGITAACVVLTVTGAAGTYFVARLQLFSLLLFPLLLLLLGSQARRPDWRICLLPPLFVVWSNLHGAAIVGLAVAGAYLLLERMRKEPAVASAVLVLSGAALFLTPALARTAEYYLDVARNESARLHVGLWARLSPSQPLDIALVLVLLVLLVLGRRYRPTLWEVAATLGLVALTLSAARNGVWLLLFLAPRVAQGRRRERPSRPPVVSLAIAFAGLVIGGIALARGPVETGASPELVTRAVQLTERCALYADGIRAEQVAAAGGRIWIGNPIDAFDREDQRRYLLWTESGDVSLLPARVQAVLVEPGSDADSALAAEPRFTVAQRDDRGVLYSRGTC